MFVFDQDACTYIKEHGGVITFHMKLEAAMGG